MSLAFEWETFDFWQPIGFTVVIFGFVMYTTDCVHLCMLKICPMYERFVNKEDQDEIEKTQSEYSKYQKGRFLESTVVYWKKRKSLRHYGLYQLNMMFFWALVMPVVKYVVH